MNGPTVKPAQFKVGDRVVIRFDAHPYSANDVTTVVSVEPRVLDDGAINYLYGIGNHGLKISQGALLPDGVVQSDVEERLAIILNCLEHHNTALTEITTLWLNANERISALENPPVTIHGHPGYHFTDFELGPAAEVVAPFQITGPGIYRMRDGMLATVTGTTEEGGIAQHLGFGWAGHDEQGIAVQWDGSGCFDPPGESQFDLVERVGDVEPAPFQITSPGLYLQRNRATARVERRLGEREFGYADGERWTGKDNTGDVSGWAEDGRYFADLSDREASLDLVERIGDLP